MSRIRHCVLCPNCLTRYLIGFSPYANGAYLVCTRAGSMEDCVLHCPCRRSQAPTRFRSSDIKTCEVTNPAYRRGFGSSDEILLFPSQRVDSMDLSAQLNLKRS